MVMYYVFEADQYWELRGQDGISKSVSNSFICLFLCLIRNC